MDSLLFSLRATVPIFLIMALGGFFKARGLVSDGFVRDADRLSYQVLLPVLLFQDLAGERVSQTFDMPFFLFGLLASVVIFAGVWLGAEVFIRDKASIGAFTQGAFRGSLAILGIAFVQNMYGNAGQVPLMIVASVPLYNMFSVLVLTVRGGNRQDTKGMVRACLKGIAYNPILIAIAVGLLFSLFGLRLPSIADKTLGMLASVATPLALLCIGAGFRRGEALAKLRLAAAASAVKLIVLPVLFLPVAFFLGFRGQDMVAILLMLGAPSTATGYVMCRNMEGDYMLSSSIIVLTTAASAFTLTAFLWLLRLAGAV